MVWNSGSYRGCGNGVEFSFRISLRCTASPSWRLMVANSVKLKAPSVIFGGLPRVSDRCKFMYVHVTYVLIWLKSRIFTGPRQISARPIEICSTSPHVHGICAYIHPLILVLRVHSFDQHRVQSGGCAVRQRCAPASHHVVLLLAQQARCPPRPRDLPALVDAVHIMPTWCTGRRPLSRQLQPRARLLTCC